MTGRSSVRDVFVVVVALLALTSLGHAAGKAENTKAYREAAWAHFRKQCKENARETILQAIENVEGIFLAKPRTRPTEKELRDQFWMGDPYGLVLYPPLQISSYLFDLDTNGIPTTATTTRSGFLYVETPAPDGGYRRHSIDAAGKRVTFVHTATLTSRYAVSWEDISTAQDRKYWVAGGKLSVLDTLTDKVLGERIGYVFESGFGSINQGRSPWLAARRNACPSIRRNAANDRMFVEQVLNPLVQERRVK